MSAQELCPKSLKNGVSTIKARLTAKHGHVGFLLSKCTCACVLKEWVGERITVGFRPS